MKNVIKILTVAIAFICIIPVHHGDLNHDGMITITDLVQLRQMVEGLREKSPFADLNYDGNVDEIDLQVMRIKLSKLNHSEVKVK